MKKRYNDRCVLCRERKPEVDHIEGVHLCEECLHKDLFQTPSPSVAYGVSEEKNQQAKADSGKPILSLVPTEIIKEIEKVRSYGVKKYKEPDNWKQVEIERYHEALLRHTLAIWNDLYAIDNESGLLHLSHIATNIAFILELMKKTVKECEKDEGNMARTN